MSSKHNMDGNYKRPTHIIGVTVPGFSRITIDEDSQTSSITSAESIVASKENLVKQNGLAANGSGHLYVQSLKADQIGKRDVANLPYYATNEKSVAPRVKNSRIVVNSNRAHKLRLKHLREALFEQDRINYEFEKKRMRLKLFHVEVQERVKSLEKLRTIAEGIESRKLAEAERKIIHQSVESAGKYLAFKNPCSLKQKHLSISRVSGAARAARHRYQQKRPDPNAKDTLTINFTVADADEGIAQLRHSLHAIETCQRSLELSRGPLIPSRRVYRELLGTSDHEDEVLNAAKGARRRLSARKVISERALHGKEEDRGDGESGSAALPLDKKAVASGDDTSAHEVKGHETPSRKEYTLVKHQGSLSHDNVFATIHERGKTKAGSQISAVRRRYPRYPPFLACEEQAAARKRAQNQRALYRRIFMDMERLKVQEEVKNAEHQQRIKQLKKQREEERVLAELPELRTGSGEHQEQGQSKYKPETSQDNRARRIRMEEIRQKEYNRYVATLKTAIREKLTHLGMNAPLLCSCGPTFWDTNPNTCANNCVFYLNPKLYLETLQAVATMSF